MRHKYFFVIVLTAVLLFGLAPAVVAQEDGNGGDRGDPVLTEARRLASEGKLADAAEVYAGWLAENPGHPEFGTILVEAADSQLAIESALELLRIYTPRVQDPGQRDRCRSSQIDLLEMLGRTEQALGLLRSFPVQPQWLYRQARLLYQQGLGGAAEESLGEAMTALLQSEGEDAERLELEARIRLLQARIYVLEGNTEQAEKLLRFLIVRFDATTAAPGILLTYYELLAAEERNSEAKVLADKLYASFPDSPEFALVRASAEDGIGYAPAPSRLLPRDLALQAEKPERTQSIQEQDRESEAADAGVESGEKIPHVKTEEERPGRQSAVTTGETAKERQDGTGAIEDQAAVHEVLVQTGSFRDRENAQYMVRDLKASGFEADIVEKRIGSSLYYRVVIGPLLSAASAQEVLMRLKDASFEGVLLFPE